MPIISITETANSEIPKLPPVREVMGVFLDGIPAGVANRNGSIWALIGAGGSGKTSQLLSLFKSKKLYRNKFSKIWYIVPMSSFLSVKDHPFQDHSRVIHELNEGVLDEIYSELLDDKEEQDNKNIQYNCVIIDDFANALKDKNIVAKLNKMLIKARHINTMFIFTLQQFQYMPKIVRKQLTFISIYKPRTKTDWNSVCDEILQLDEKDCKKIYEYVFDKPYEHLDIDTFEGKFYKSYNLLNIKNNDAI